MAGIFSITVAVAQGMLNSTGLAEALGASPKTILYSGTMPASANASLSGNTVLATLVGAATPFSGFTDTGTAARATMGAIANATAVATGTSTFYRHLDNAGTTVKAQGDVGTAGTALILNTASITTGSTVSITAGTIDFPYGP